jgi:hypothetical protein
MMELGLDAICTPSEDVVSREIEGELIIVPLAAGIGDAEDDLYTMNETGKAVWARLDGKRTLRAVSTELAAEFNAPPGEIEEGVLGLMKELVRRRMVVVRPV